MDREVFAIDLPVHEASEADMRQWLEAHYGPVEHFNLLRKPGSGALNGRAYITFAQHQAAQSCVSGKQNPFTAQWSESERLLRCGKGVYNQNAMPLFEDLINTLSKAGASLCLAVGSENHPRGVIPGTSVLLPPWRQLHFSALCGEQKFGALQAALSDVLSSFHRKLMDPTGGQAGAPPQQAGGNLENAQAPAAEAKSPSNDLTPDILDQHVTQVRILCENCNAQNFVGFQPMYDQYSTLLAQFIDKVTQLGDGAPEAPTLQAKVNELWAQLGQLKEKLGAFSGR